MLVLTFFHACQEYFCLLLGISQNESALIKHFIFIIIWPHILLSVTAGQWRPQRFHTGMHEERRKVSYNQEVWKKLLNHLGARSSDPGSDCLQLFWCSCSNLQSAFRNYTRWELIFFTLSEKYRLKNGTKTFEIIESMWLYDYAWLHVKQQTTPCNPVYLTQITVGNVFLLVREKQMWC